MYKASLNIINSYSFYGEFSHIFKAKIQTLKIAHKQKFNTDGYFLVQNKIFNLGEKNNTASNSGQWCLMLRAKSQRTLPNKK